MVTIGKYNGDINCWGLSHNDFHRGLMQVPENIDVQLNSTANNDPLTLKAGSQFFIWGSSGITISANSSGNASYPAGSTYDYFRPSAVYTSTDFTVSWASTQITSTGGNGTYYMTCKGGVDSTEVGRGQIDYLMSSVFTPAFSRGMNGWYGTTAGSTEWRALARFIMTAGVMSRACVFIDHELPAGYISNINVFSTGTNVYLSPFTADLGNKGVKYLQEINLIAIAGLTASTWYSVCVNETDYTITNSSNAGSFSDWTITGNQLNAYSVYNSQYNYCRATISSTAHRVLDIYTPSSGSSKIYLSFPFYNYPKAYVYVQSSGSSAVPANTKTKPEFTAIIADVNSNMTTATSYIYTSLFAERLKFRGSYIYNASSYAIGNVWWYLAEKSDHILLTEKIGSRVTFPAASTTIIVFVPLTAEHVLTKGETVSIYLYHTSSATQTITGTTGYNFLEIIGY